MYASPYFAQLQQMMPGFVQPYPPIFQTPESGRKRDSSPLLLLSGEKDEKRSRNDGLSGSSSDPSALEGQEVTLADIMNHPQKLGTKEDLVQVKSTIVAPSAEIQQLKGEINSHVDRMKLFEGQMGARAAIDLNRMQQRPETDNVNRKQLVLVPINNLTDVKTLLFMASKLVMTTP